jgi:hypothetical protein
MALYQQMVPLHGPETMLVGNYIKEKSLCIDLLPQCSVFYLTYLALCQEENLDLKKRGKT